MVNIKDFCKWIRDLDDNQIRKLKDIGHTVTEIVNYIKAGYFEGLTFTKENYQKELATIMRYADTKGFKYSFTNEIITYMNHYNGINHGEYCCELANLHDAGYDQSANYTIDRILLSYPDSEYDRLSYHTAETLSDAVMLLFIRTKGKRKPDKEQFENFISHKIVQGSSEYELSRFASNILGTFIDTDYFLECLLEVCEIRDIKGRLFDSEMYKVFHRHDKLNTFILNTLIDAGYDELTTMDYLYSMYYGQDIMDFIKEVLPYDIKFIKVLYRMEAKFAQTSNRGISFLNDLAYRLHPKECTDKQDEYEYSLPVRQLLILIKTCIKKNIARGQDSRLLGKVLSGLVLIHDYNFTEIVNSMYNGKTSIF